MTDTRDAGVVLQLKIPLPLFTSLGILRKIVFEACLGILYHRAEFIAGKHAPVLSDTLMRKEHSPRVIDVDQHGNDRHDRENSDQPHNTAYEVKAPFQPAVERTAQVIVGLQQNDLLAHEADGRETSHRDPDEIRRDDNAGDKRLNAVDEPHLRFLLHPGCGDDHVAHSGSTNDTFRIVKSAKDRIRRRDFIADGMVVQKAYDVVVKSRVIFKRSQYPLRREPRSNEEYRHAEQMQRAHAFAVKIAPAPKEEHRKNPRHTDKDTRDHLAYLREIHQQDDDEYRVDARPKNLLHHNPKRHVAAARPHRIQEPEKDKGNDAEDIDVGDIKMRVGDGQPVPAQLIGKELRSHHGGIVYKDNEQRQEIGSIAFPQRQASHASPPLSKIPQTLQQKHPPENGHTRECAAVDDAVARELRIGVHLLRHGKAGNRTGRCIDRDERHELHIPHTESDRDREHDPGHDDETCCNRSDELRQMRMETSAPERSAEDDEGNRRRCRRDLCGRSQDRCGDMQLRNTAERPEDTSEDHGIHHDAAQDIQEIEPSPAKRLQYEHREHIIERNNGSNHHRRNSDRIRSEDISHERHAHENVVPAVRRLYDDAAARVVLFKNTDNPRRDECRQQHPAHAEAHEERADRRPRLRRVDVIEHHEEEKHPEHHAVHMEQLFIREQPHAPYKEPDRHQAEERHHAAKCNEKVAKHTDAPS